MTYVIITGFNLAHIGAAGSSRCTCSLGSRDWWSEAVRDAISSSSYLLRETNQWNSGPFAVTNHTFTFITMKIMIIWPLDYEYWKQEKVEYHDIGLNHREDGGFGTLRTGNLKMCGRSLSDWLDFPCGISHLQDFWAMLKQASIRKNWN